MVHAGCFRGCLKGGMGRVGEGWLIYMMCRGAIFLNCTVYYLNHCGPPNLP